MESSVPPPLPSSQPRMTPQFCFNTTALRDFLRLSRATVDDSLSLHLNSLLTPSRTPFLPSATSTRSLSSSTSRRQIPASACHDFKSGILFPSWQARQDVLMYCSQVANDPDTPPEPPPRTITHYMHMPSDKANAVPIASYTLEKTSQIDPYAKQRSRNYWGEDQVVDERTDPYSARDYSYTREARTQVLKDLLTNEEGVERIIRSRTWSLLAERCLDSQGGFPGGTLGGPGYEGEWSAWREGRRR